MFVLDLAQADNKAVLSKHEVSCKVQRAFLQEAVGIAAAIPEFPVYVANFIVYRTVYFG